MTEPLRRAGQLSWAIVGIAALLAIVALVAWSVRVIFPPLILAGAIVFLLNPLVARLQRRGLPRFVGTVVAYLAVLVGLAASAALVVPVASHQAEELAEAWPTIERRAERWLDSLAMESQGTFLEFERRDIEGLVDDGDRSFRDQLDLARALGVRVLHVLLVLLLGPVIAFYLLVDLPHVTAVAQSLVPPGARGEVLHVVGRVNRAMGGFFRGQLLVAILVGLLCSLGLFIIDLRFWFLVGMIAGFFNIVPLIGPWVGGVPGVVIALTTGSPLQALLVVAVMAGAQQVDNHFITPQVMYRAVQLHPAVVVLALLAGGATAGFFGLLLAVPLAAVLKIVLGHVWRVHVLGEPYGDAAGDGGVTVS